MDVGIVEAQAILDGKTLLFQQRMKGRALSSPNVSPVLAKVERPSQQRSQNRLGRSKGAVKIHLTEHVVTRLKIIFDSVESAGRYIKPIIFLIDLDRLDDPLKIENSILRSGHMR